MQVREIQRIHSQNHCRDAKSVNGEHVGQKWLQQSLQQQQQQMMAKIVHRFFIAISRAVVNHDGFAGTAPDPLVWSAGSLPKRRRLVHAVRDLALLPGPPDGGLLVLLLLLMLTILPSGLTLQVFWLSGFLFLAPCTGLLMVGILELVVFLMLSFLFYTSCGLVRG